MGHAEIYFAIRNYVLFGMLFVLAFSVGYLMIDYLKRKCRDKNKKNHKK